MNDKVDPIAYALRQLRLTQLKLLSLGSEQNVEGGSKADLVTDIWVAALEMASAIEVIREHAEETKEKEEKGIIRRFNRKVNEELSLLLPRVNHNVARASAAHGRERYRRGGGGSKTRAGSSLPTPMNQVNPRASPKPAPDVRGEEEPLDD